MNYARACLAAALLLIVSADFSLADNDWEFLFSREGIDSYQRHLEGTEVREFLGIGFVEAHIAVLGAVLADVDGYPEWVARCRSAEAVRQVNGEPGAVYFIMSSPFPYKDRDLVVTFQTREIVEKGLWKIDFGLCREDDVPEKKGQVRIPYMKGDYLFEYFGPRTTRMTYRYQVDPGGNVPLNLANNVEIKNYPYINISQIRAMVARDKYQRAGRASTEYERIEKVVGSREGLMKIIKSRAEPYITDEHLLDLLCEEVFSAQKFSPDRFVSDARQRKGTADNSGLSPVQRYVLEMLVAAVNSPVVGEYIAEKPLEAFFSVEAMLRPREAWLRQALLTEERFLSGFFDNSNGLLEKAFQAEDLVRRWMADEGLAETVLGHPRPGKTIAANKAVWDRLVSLRGDPQALAKSARIIAEYLSSNPD